MRFLQQLRSNLRDYPRLLWVLGAGAFLNVMGLSFLWPITTIYIHEHLGKPLTVAGWVLLLHSGGAAVGSLVGGYLFDRIGARRVMLLGLLSSAAIICLPGFFSSWPLFVTVMLLYGITATLVFPAMNALAGKAWPEGGRRAFNFIYVCHNMGVAVGTAVGGLLAQRSFNLAFLGASVLSLVFAVYVTFVIPKESRAEAKARQETAAAAEGDERPVPWVPIIALFVGFLTLWAVYVQWQATVSVFMQGLGIPLSAYSLLWTINGLVIVLGQPLLSLVLKLFRSLTSQLFLGTVLIAGSFGLLLAAHAYPVFVTGMVILTFGEMLLWPGIPAAVSHLSPPSRRGFLQGFIGSGATVGRMLGPLMGGMLYDHFGYPRLLMTMVGLLLIPLVSFLVYQQTAD